MKKLVWIALAVGLAAGAYTFFVDPSVSASSSDVSYTYLVKYTGGAKEKRRLPMLIALHGNGDTPEHFFETALDTLKVPARVILLKGPVKQGLRTAWPWTPQDHLRFGQALSEVVPKLTRKYRTVGKPVLFGFSGGGMMAYDQAATAGDQYSAIFAVSGRLSKADLAGRPLRTGAPVTAYHGQSDNVVSIGGAKEAVQLLEEAGATVDWHEVKGGHLAVFRGAKQEITERMGKALSALVEAEAP